MVIIALASQHTHSVDGCNSETCCDIASQDHVDSLIRGAGIEHSLDGIDINDLAVLNHKASWSIHPGVRADDEPCRGQAANPDREGAKPVRTRRETIPAI